jgi:hypothetical protein
MGTTVAVFQRDGSLPTAKLFLKMRKKGRARTRENFLRRKLENPSGPIECLFSRKLSDRYTSRRSKSTESKEEFDSDEFIRGVPLSEVNTEQKYLLKSYVCMYVCMYVLV